MTCVTNKRLNDKLLNLIRNFSTKILLILISVIIFIYFMLYGQFLTENDWACQSYSFDTSEVAEHRFYRDECLLDRFIIQPEIIELSLPSRQEIIPRDAVWQTVRMEKEKFFIYSAYLDTRMKSVGPVIRIIATAKTYFPKSVWCRLWYLNSSKTVSAFTHAVMEHRDFPYSPSFVLCKLPPEESIGNYPLSVSVVSDIQDPITNEVLVQIPNKTSEFKSDIAVCVQPFHSQYDQGSRLIEFIELYYILGVRHFTFYNFSVSPKIQCVLDRYKNDNLISVLPWNLDLISDVEVKTEGTNAAFNDCLYRNMYTSKYIAIVDVDEMIIPRSNLTLIQLLKQIDSLFIEIPDVYSYLFRNSFFCMDWGDDEFSPFNQNRTNIVVLRKTYRQGFIHPPSSRTKYICNPRQVIEVGNHMVSEFLKHRIDATVITPTGIALLQHYRFCNTIEDNCEGNKPYCISWIVEDRSIYTYKDELVKRITNTRNRLNENCVST